MKISEKIIQMIGEERFVINPVTESSNLYDDLGYNSLEFIRLLLKIEEAYSIKFELLEMSDCLHTGGLIELVKEKLKEFEYD